ncbi:phenolic glucoside malonyltransferase 1-like [Fagus crenata]
MASHNSVKILEVCPMTPLPSSLDSATTTSLPLTFFDILWLRFPSHSLSVTLQYFLPLAGMLTWPQDSHKPIINYKEGDAVSLTIAESSANNFYHLSSNNFVEAVEYHPFVPDLAISHEQAPVLALQVTTFSNCGLCIGITTHHAVLDGKSSTMFMKSWAHLCKNALSSSLVPDLTPSFDRMVIKDLSRLETIYLNQWFGIKNTPPDVVRGTFELTRTNLEKLRQLITNMLEEKNEQQQLVVHLSRLTLTWAYTWVDTKLHLGINVDARPRLEPPIPGNYFGNCISLCGVVAERNDLLGENGVAVAAKAISDAIRSLDDGVLSDAENWLSLFISLLTNKTADRATGTAGSPRFELYNTDFGWGKPMKVEMISIDRTGAISVSDTRDGAGGIKVGLVLKKHEMKVFASIYAKGLEVL